MKSTIKKPAEIADYTPSQLMVTAAAREIADKKIVFVGMRLPLLGFLLAKSTHAPDAIGVYELGIVRDTPAPESILTMGDLPNLFCAQWLADTIDLMGLLQQGKVDIAFIGGAQVDRFGNLNTSYVGGHGKNKNQTSRKRWGLRSCQSCQTSHHHYAPMKKDDLYQRWITLLLPATVMDGDGESGVGLPRGGASARLSQTWVCSILTQAPVKWYLRRSIRG